MKRLFALILSLAMVMALAACGGNDSGSNNSNSSNNSSDGGTYSKASIKLSCNGTDQGNDTKAAKKFEELIEDRSGGAIQVDVFNNDQLAAGDMAKGLEMVMNGSVQMDIHSTSIMANLDNNFMVCTMPWAFSDYQSAEDTIFGAGGEYLDTLCQSKGLTYLGATHNGFKMMTCNIRQIQTPEDLKGLKIRVPGGKFFSDFYSAYGASPQAMSWAEVFSALQQGTIDGHDNSISTCYSNNIQEVQKYFTNSRHTYEAFNFTANTKWFTGLNEATQTLIRECVEEACKTINQETVNNEETLIAECEAAGCEFYTFTEEDVETWRAPIAGLIEEYKGIYGADACKAFGIS